MSLKYSFGKLQLIDTTPEQFIAGIEDIGLQIIAPTAQEWATYYKLLKIENHKDLFDRMLIWHAMQRDLTLISSDQRFSQFKPHGLKLLG